MNILIPILSNLLFGFLTSHLAQKRGRDGMTWFVIGILLGIFGLALLFLLPPASKQEPVGPTGSEERHRWEKEPSSAIDSSFIHEEIEEEIEWYYVNKKQEQRGPYSPREFLQLCREGELQENSFIWSEEMKGWKRAKEVPSILDEITSSQNGEGKSS